MTWLGSLGKILGMSGDAPKGERGPDDDFWYAPVGGMSAAGVQVTPSNAVKVAAVRACLKVLAQPIASLPLGVFRRLPDGSKQKADDHPLFAVLQTEPNERNTAYEFRGQMQWDLAGWGNAYAEILQGERGPIDQLVRHDPATTIPRRRGGSIWYQVHEQGGSREIHETSIWHLKTFPLASDGICGVAPIEDGAEAIGQALVVQDYAGRFFRNDTQSGGIIETATKFDSDQSRDNFLKAWRRARTGRNAHKDAVLMPGMKYTRSGQTNVEAQFLELRKELAIEIARIWQIPPHKIGILDRATFSNIEQQALEFVTDTLLPWVELWEQAISRHLILQDGYFAEFNLAGLLRGDTASRYEAYAKGRQWGWLSANDIRRMENMDPIDGGNDYLQPMNMVPIGTLQQPAQRSAVEGYTWTNTGLLTPR